MECIWSPLAWVFVDVKWLMMCKLRMQSAAGGTGSLLISVCAVRTHVHAGVRWLQRQYLYCGHERYS
jgi:hypothetical protein